MSPIRVANAPVSWGALEFEGFSVTHARTALRVGGSKVARNSSTSVSS